MWLISDGSRQEFLHKSPSARLRPVAVKVVGGKDSVPIHGSLSPLLLTLVERRLLAALALDLAVRLMAVIDVVVSGTLQGVAHVVS